MAKRKPEVKKAKKKVKKPSDKGKKLHLTKEEFDALVKRHHEGEKRMREKLRRDSRIDPKYLRIPFTFRYQR